MTPGTCRCSFTSSARWSWSGGLALSAISLIAAWRSGSAALTKLGFMSLFYGAIPGYILMRGGAQWIAHKEGLDNDDVDLTWINIGFSVSDLGFVLLIVSLVIGGIAVRRINRGEGGTPSISARIASRPGLALPCRVPGRRLGDDRKADLVACESRGYVLATGVDPPRLSIRRSASRPPRRWWNDLEERWNKAVADIREKIDRRKGEIDLDKAEKNAENAEGRRVVRNRLRVCGN